MSLSGLGFVAIWHNLLPEAKEEFYEWHNREHMPERLGIPGFSRGRRYIALKGVPEYFNLYEADSADVLGGVEYIHRLNSPTTWTKAVVASFRNVARSICRVQFSAGVGQGAFIATLQFDIEVSQRATMISALRTKYLPPLVENKSVVGVHFGLADEAISNVMTNEKKARAEGTDVPTWVVMIEGGTLEAVEKAANDLRSQIASNTAPILAIYQLQYNRNKLPWSAG